MSDMTSLLIVTAIENFTADNGREFQKVSFVEKKFFQGKEIKTRNVGIRNIWGKSVNGDVKADPYFKNLRINDPVEGQIVRFNTIPYKIGDRTVTSWKGVVFSDENPVSYANSQLQRNNSCVVDENGVEIVPNQVQSTAPVNVAVPSVEGDEDTF